MDIMTHMWTCDGDGGRYAIVPVLKGRADLWFDVYFNGTHLAIATHPANAIEDLPAGKITSKVGMTPDVAPSLAEWVKRERPPGLRA